MKLTPEEIKQRNEARRVRATSPITDPEELARRKARYVADRLHDDGTTMVVEDTLYAISLGKSRGRNLLNVMLQLATHLTPEQQLGLAQCLPDLLSPEALSILAERAETRLAGSSTVATQSEAG